MPNINLKQITDKLNAEFTGDTRKLVFWYDGGAEFAEDIDALELENAKVLRLEPNNQFYIKYFLEREDTTTNYLVYAPFAKPHLRDNHLADTIRYSKEFFADRASIILADLGIGEQFKPVIMRHIKFFANKDRAKKFYDLQIENCSNAAIEAAMMAVLCKCKTASFEEVVRQILTGGSLDNNKYLAEFEKYGLIDAFWQQAAGILGYCDDKPTLNKLVVTMFVTYASKSIQTDMPAAWQKFVSYKSGSIIAFMDNLMNSSLYGGKFDELSQNAYAALNAGAFLEKTDVEALLDCDIFSNIDELIIGWQINRLENEDTGAKLLGKDIPQICEQRRKKHFGKRYDNEYLILENAFYIISNAKFQPLSGIKNLIKNYTQNAYKVDRAYRYFYYYFDRIENTAPFEKLRELTENIYTNEFLNHITVNWNTEYATGEKTGLVNQRDFFSKYVEYSKDRTVVFISDALRYDVARTLFDKLTADEKCAVSIDAMQGVLPSYTPLGMAALLPHKNIEYNDNYNVLVDGKACDTIKQREALLQEYKTNANCVAYDTLKTMKQAELRNIFTGRDVVYIYHNQIDARGDKPATENEVFTACEEAIEEIYTLIKRISSQANTHHFIVTADHGFIYKRDKIKENDKIAGSDLKTNYAGQRYLISQKELNTDGVCSTTVGSVLNNADSRVITFPLASDIFKVSGAGQNYVHGGCSPQEILIPVIDIKVDKGKVETSPAQIALVSPAAKITSLITTLDFIQTEPISDVIKEAAYRVYFITESGEKISNENILIADKKDADAVKRMFRLRFNFKNKKYNNSAKYYLIVYDDKNDIEVSRNDVIIDMAFADDFGFFN